MTGIQSGLVGTKTEKNLYDAAVAESKSSAKFSIFGAVANEEGYHDIGDTFEMIADQEKEHADIWLGYLGEIGDTMRNLESAGAGEEYEATNMYPAFEKIAREEGFDEIANKFSMISDIENANSDAFLTYLNQMETDTLFRGEPTTTWQCLNCGFRHTGRMAPERCPVCSYSRGIFRRMPQ